MKAETTNCSGPEGTGDAFDVPQSANITQTPHGESLGDDTQRQHGIVGDTPGGKYASLKDSAVGGLVADRIGSSFTKHPSGLLVPIVQDSSSVIEDSNTELAGPHIIYESPNDPLLVDTSDKELILPTDNELLMYSAPIQIQKEVQQRTSTELAVAFHKPQIFLAGEVEKRLSEKEMPQIREVLQNLRTQGDYQRQIGNKHDIL